MRKTLTFLLVVAAMAVLLAVSLSCSNGTDRSPVTPQADITGDVDGLNWDLAYQANDYTVIIPLGSAVDPQSGKIVDGMAILHYPNGVPEGIVRNGAKKPPGTPGGGGGGGTTDGSNCYGTFGNGVKWKVVENYIVNPANNGGLSTSAVLPAMVAAIDQWEDACDGVLNNGGSINVIGSGSATTDPLSVDTVSPDGQNEVFFQNAPGSAIAVTSVWGTFYGPPGWKEIVEWDQIYDDVDFTWSMTGAPLDMDFPSIAQHETGHTFGLDDLYDAACSDQTMYGYGSEGDTKARTLEAGDIAGADSIY